MDKEQTEQAVIPAPASSPAVIPATPLTAQDVKDQVQLIAEVMAAVMEEGHHYGTIPGTGDKPTLLKPGAEKLCLTFRLAPMLHVSERDLGGGHREFQVRCTLVHIPTGRVYGEGVGSCSSMESRYRYRQAERQCPVCEKTTIIKGKAEYGGGWLCFQRKGGCGAKFADHDPKIMGQQVGRIENPDIADVTNTILKMAKKRALVDATLTATAASDCFYQDLEDFSPPEVAVPAKGEPATAAAPYPKAPSVAPPPPSPLDKTLPSRLLTKGQQEILLLSQRCSRVSDSAFRTYLAQTFHVAELKALKQSDVQAVLEWLEAQQAEKIQAAEDQAGAIEATPRPRAGAVTTQAALTQQERQHLLQLLREQKLDPEGFKRWLKATHGTEQYDRLHPDRYETVVEQIIGGIAAQWITDNADDVPTSWPQEEAAQ